MPFLSIVIPAFNEEKRIAPTLQKVLEYLERQSYDAEILVVNDGSTDATASLVRAAGKGNPMLRLVETAHRGKGHAVKTGMLQAQGSFRFLCDADLAMPVEEVGKFLPPHLSDVDVAIGSREAPGARRYSEPPYRHLMGRVFNGIVRALTVRGIRDTQCGFKCFSANAAESLFEQQRLDGFGFDVEILFLAQKRHLRVQEVPINWYYQTESKVRPVRDTVRMLLEAGRVRLNYHLGQYRIATATDPGTGVSDSQAGPMSQDRANDGKKG